MRVDAGEVAGVGVERRADRAGKDRRGHRSPAAGRHPLGAQELREPVHGEERDGGDPTGAPERTTGRDAGVVRRHEHRHGSERVAALQPGDLGREGGVCRRPVIIIISHDRHFLNSVCTHMADLDYGEIRVYPGNYDAYMTASTQVREQMLSNNAKKKSQIAELQSFVSRFSANASKARQATSRARQIEKIKLEDVKPSSRQYPYIRFEVDEKDKLHRLAVTVTDLSKGYPEMEKPLLDKFNISIEAGEKVAIIGPNGIGKTTLLRCLEGDLELDAGKVKWTDRARSGICAQDHASDFEEEASLTDWMTQWRQASDDDQAIRSVLGRLLFSGDEVKKSVKVISGGEQGRMIFGRLILQKPNVLLMDEPTNHLDMESIESLNLALEKYTGTLIFVSHDREFVSSLATRIIELKPDGINDFKGNYEDYLQYQGIQ